MTAGEEKATKRARSEFLTLFAVEAKLSLREPYALGGGIGLPVVLLLVFGFISKATSGNVSGSGLSVIDLYIPTIMVISFMGIAVSFPSTLVRDREIGWLRRISTTPVHPSRLLGAQLALNLILAAVAIIIVLVGGSTFFGATLRFDIPLFLLSTVLAIIELFSLGLLVVAFVSSQTVASAVSGPLFFVLMFLSGLWVQPVQVGGLLENIMWYSPSGAAVRAILDAAFTRSVPVPTLLALAGYTAAFAFVATRYFRWE